MMFQINGVDIEDTYCETFRVRIARLLVTSVSRKWAYESAMETKGLGRSAAIPPCEASLETELGPEATPDNQPGFVIQLLDRKLDSLREWLIIRIRKGVMPYPKTNVFDALPRETAEESIDIKDTMIQTFGDGFEQEIEAFGRRVFRIPRMDGFFHTETRFQVAKGVAGGMFLILADSDESALRGAEKALEAVQIVPNVVGKFAASGTKVGGRNYKSAVATTNDAYCPSLSGGIDSKITKDVKCVYEVIVNGLNSEVVTVAMKAGIKEATRVAGVLKITSANYGGTLGKGKIALRSLFESEIDNEQSGAG